MNRCPGHGPCPRASEAAPRTRWRADLHSAAADEAPIHRAETAGRRTPVAGLVNPVSETLLSAAEAAIESVISRRLFVLTGEAKRQFRVRLANPHQLDLYLQSGLRPPRFPAGGRQRLLSMWKSRKPGTQIEVTEFMAISALRAID